MKHVIDTNVLIHGSSQELPFEEMITVPEVTEELRSTDSINRFETEKIAIYSPSEKIVEQVKEKADDINSEVSDADIKLVSLAKEKEAILVTDDYHMQNLAEKTNTIWKSFQKKGIDDSFEWKKICSNCEREIEKDRCPLCGGEYKLVSN